MADTHDTAPDTESQNFERCEHCGAPADRDQRYCVNCGTHRRHVPDPAAKYMSRVSAHTGPVAGGVVAGVQSSSGAGAAVGQNLGLLGALAIALIPVAAAVGVVIGRSSNNQDSKVIAALNHQGTMTTVVASGAASSGSAADATVTTTAKTSKPAKKTKTKTKTAAAKSTSTANGKVTKVTGSKVTASQQSQGSAEAKKIQSATGTNYVQSANNLPSSVVVGP